LRGTAQQLAEVYYIVGAQQLDGYGQECFLAKDERGSEVLIGASLTGIVVRRGNVLSPQFFKWMDITNLVNHKRFFGIECQNYEFSAQFVLDEPDSAKYVWKMCVLQHTFYKMHSSAAVEAGNGNGGNGDSVVAANWAPPYAHVVGGDQQPPHQMDIVIGPEQSGLPAYPATIQHAEIQNFHLQTQRVDISPMKLGSGPHRHLIHQPPPHGVEEQHGEGPLGGGRGRRLEQHLDPSMATVAANNTTLHQQSFNNYVLQHSNSSVNVNSEVAVNSGLSAAHSIGDLDQHHQQSSHQRPVPDYETAIRNKYGTLANSILQQQSSNYTSQPSLVADALRNDRLQQQQQQQQQNFVEGIYQNQLPHLENGFSQTAVTAAAFSSTPELNRINLNHHIPHHALQHQHQQQQQRLSNDQLAMAEMQRMDLSKAPPPYAGEWRECCELSSPRA